MKKEQKEISESGFYLDTQCTISIYTDDETAGKELVGKAFELCGKYESKMSKTAKGSDVYKINHSKGRPVEVDDDTAEVIRLGIEMGKESGGDFDITIGRLTDLWNFKAKDPKVPSRKKINEALKTVDYHNVVVDGSKVSIRGGRAKLDLGGIAKGYISQKVAGYLEKQGVQHGIINFGGNVVLIGGKPDGSDWNVGIQDPNGENQQVIGSVKASDKAVITSGIYERKFEKNGKIYHHIIDPKTGYPVFGDVEGVSLECSSRQAAKCDAYSTICLLKGSWEGKKFIESKEGFDALFYCKDGKITKTKDIDFEPAG